MNSHVTIPRVATVRPCLKQPIWDIPTCFLKLKPVWLEIFSIVV